MLAQLKTVESKWEFSMEIVWLSVNHKPLNGSVYVYVWVCLYVRVYACLYIQYICTYARMKWSVPRPCRWRDCTSNNTSIDWYN